LPLSRKNGEEFTISLLEEMVAEIARLKKLV
jgi:hypothetical protein